VSVHQPAQLYISQNLAKMLIANARSGQAAENARKTRSTCCGSVRKVASTANFLHGKGEVKPVLELECHQPTCPVNLNFTQFSLSKVFKISTEI